MQTIEHYGISKTMSAGFDQAMEQVKEAFKEEGFGVLSTIDVQAALKEKLGEEIEPYTILGMCNPKLAYSAIQAEPEVGALLPCNVLVRQTANGTEITAQNPSLFASLTSNPSMGEIAEEARERIDRALAHLS